MALKSWPKTLTERGRPTAEVSDSSLYAQPCLLASTDAKQGCGGHRGFLLKCNGDHHKKLQ